MQVSALGLCHVGDSSSHTFDDELVVIIAQWTSNTVHLLSWPSLVGSLSSFPSSLSCVKKTQKLVIFGADL